MTSFAVEKSSEERQYEIEYSPSSASFTFHSFHLYLKVKSKQTAWQTEEDRKSNSDGLRTQLPFHLFGITGDKESQRPLLHLDVISRVDQNAV